MLSSILAPTVQVLTLRTDSIPRAGESMMFSTGFTITARPDSEGLFEGGPPEDRTGIAYTIQPPDPTAWPSHGLISGLAESALGYAVADWLERRADPSTLVPATITIRVDVEPTDRDTDEHIRFENLFLTGIRPSSALRTVSDAGEVGPEVVYGVDPVDPRTSRAAGISGPGPAHLIGTAIAEWLATGRTLSPYTPATVRVEVEVEHNEVSHLP